MTTNIKNIKPAECKAVQDELRSAKEAEEKRKREARAQRVAEAAQWAQEHGSERLRLALELGLLEQSMGFYYSERLKKELPRWRWQNPGDYICEIWNPSLEALAAFKVLSRADADKSEIPSVLRGIELVWNDRTEESPPERYEALRAGVTWAGDKLAIYVIPGGRHEVLPDE